MMRAAQYRRYGNPDVIEIVDVSVKPPNAGEVLVRVRASSVNGGEAAMRAGLMRMLTGRSFPRGIGIDFAGEIVGVGDGLDAAQIGAHVWGMLRNRDIIRQKEAAGTAAEFVTVDAATLAPLPKTLEFGQAVSLLAGNAALVSLRDRAALKKGERLLVRGGTGGVGFVGVQLGHVLGAEVTTLVSAANIPVAQQIGADVALDHRETTAADLGPFDVIFDTVGSDMASYRRLLSKGGRMVTLGANPPLQGFAAILASSFAGSRRIQYFLAEPTPSLLRDYADLIDDGRIRPLIASEHSLADIAAAHRAFERGGVPGKHVVMS